VAATNPADRPRCQRDNFAMIIEILPQERTARREGP
jgi:hypothetical protein